ncbi:MAG: hypothetical protein WBD24_05995 [Candidatus Omnitrophota bacterium]
MLNKIYTNVAGVNICVDYDTPECGEVTRGFLKDFPSEETAEIDFNLKFSSEKSLLKFNFTHHENDLRNDNIGMSVEMGSISKDARFAVLPDMADQSIEVAEFILDNLLRICLQYILPGKRGIILHSSAVAERGKSFVFVGPNDGGKSTIARNTARQVLSDDCVALRKTDEGIWMGCATPWGDVHTTGEYPLEAIFFIEKSDSFYCERVSSLSAVKGLFANASFSFPDTEKHAGEILEKVLDVVTGVSESVPVYRMGFRKEDNVLELMNERGATWNSAVSMKR